MTALAGWLLALGLEPGPRGLRRQACLERLFARGASSLLQVDGFVGEGVWLFKQAQLLELDGISAKRLDSPYLAGQRTDAWLKVKRSGATPAQRFTRPARIETS